MVCKANLESAHEKYLSLKRVELSHVLPKQDDLSLLPCVCVCLSLSLNLSLSLTRSVSLSLSPS